MDLTLMWLGIELRTRRLQLTALALLIAFAVAPVVIAMAGARRGASAVDRLRERTLPATAVVSPNTEEGFDWSRVRALPDVEAVATFPRYSGFAVDEAPGKTAAVYMPADREAMRTIERPVVLAGRLADPARVDEAVVTAGFVSRRHRGVGDTVTVRLFTPEQVDTGASGVPTAIPARPEGPAIRVVIVGVVRSLWHGDDASGEGRLFPSPALLKTYRANILGAAGNGAMSAIVRLRGGAAALPAFRENLARLTGRSDIDVTDRSDVIRHAQDIVRFESVWLLAFALAALVAALVLVGQSIARYAAGTVADLQRLRPLGMTSAHVRWSAAAAPFLAGVAGTVIGCVAAVFASTWMPIGAASRLEPTPGSNVDWMVLAPCLLLIPAIALVGSAAFASATASRVWADARTGKADSRGSVVARAAARAGLPVPMSTGTRFALERGRGRDALPVRPALLGAVTGVAGVFAALTLSTGVADAVGHGERFGQTYQLSFSFGFNGVDLVHPTPVLARLAGLSEVEEVADVRYAVGDAGTASVLTFDYGGASGDRPLLVLTSGRLPVSDDEILLAPKTALQLRTGIGSVFDLKGQGGTTPMRVVGIGLLPQTSYNDYASGAWVTKGGYKRLFAEFFLNHAAFVTLRPGVDPVEALPQLPAGAGDGANQSLFADLMPVPQQLDEIRGIRLLPVALGGFLAVLALGAVGHVLGAAARRRGRDIAVLRALGMTRPQAVGVLVTQSSVVAGFGLLFGVPLGLTLGRLSWHLVANTMPLAYVSPVRLLSVPAVAAVTLLAASVLVIPAGLRTVRRVVADELRSE